MHKITLLTVGSIKTSWITDGCDHYVQRIQHDVDLQVMEVPAGKQKDPDRQKEEECDRILERLEKCDGEVWALDTSGKTMSSNDFESALDGVWNVGRSVVFVLGGAYGLDDRVRQKADRVLSLSAMTFPHELCRVIFLEQLYRAVQIGKGSGYHH